MNLFGKQFNNVVKGEWIMTNDFSEANIRKFIMKHILEDMRLEEYEIKREKRLEEDRKRNREIERSMAQRRALIEELDTRNRRVNKRRYRRRRR